MAGVRIVDHLRAGLNLHNVTGTRYLNSLKWGKAFYAAPRSAVVSLNFEY